MGIRSSRCPDSGHQKQMSGDRGYTRFRPPDLWENAVRPVSPRGGPDEPVDEPQFGPRVGRRRGVEFL